MFAIILAGLAAAGATPVVDGQRLVEGQQCYEMRRDGKPYGFTRQTVKSASSVLGPAWAISIEQVLSKAGFSFNDHFLLRKADLKPIAFHTDLKGQEIARLMYSDGRIVGWKRDKDKVVPVDVVADGHVLEGNLFGPTLTAMPLKKGASFRPTRYQYHEGLGTFAIDVEGEEMVATPFGTKPVWKVAMGFKPERRATYLIGKDNGVEYGYSGNGFANLMIADCRPVEAALEAMAAAKPKD